MAHSTDESQVYDALREVEDPEAGMNIVDLGLVYGVAITDARIAIDMTMTTAACPMVDMITDDVRAVLERIAPGVDVDVQLVWDPPWTPERMSQAARSHFGWGG